MKVRWLLLVGLGLVVGAVGGYLLASSPTTLGSDRVPAWLEAIQRICTSVGGLGTFAALIYVIRQFNLVGDQNKLVQKNILASLDGQLYARLDSFNRCIVEHAEEYRLLEKEFTDEERTSHKPRLHHLCDLGFSFYEQIYKHHVRYDLLPTEDWDEWQHNMAHFFAKPYVRGYWPTVQERFAKGFRMHVQELMAHG
jgi:hypothetical protein